MTPTEVHLAWKARLEIAVVDVREESVFALGHPLFASCLPLGRIELGLHDLIPRRDSLVVVYDDGDGLAAATAIERLREWGYTNVRELDGGMAGWVATGLELFEDVNSPSKAFGELVEHFAGTPYIEAPDLQALIKSRADIAILDARRFDEYATMSIPGSISVPGAELVLRAKLIAPDPATTIVVNCAGRTRSIIGAQSLINAGVPNPIKALRNGTIGWTLEGQELERGQTRSYESLGQSLDPGTVAQSRRFAYRAGVRRIGYPDLEQIAAVRTLYRFDVRSQAEFVTRHPAGFQHVAGGQLVQETDMYAPVRGAAIAVFDDLETRAWMTAGWLAQMGWDALVVDPESVTDWGDGDFRPADAAAPACDEIGVPQLERLLNGNSLLLDFATSSQFRKGHIPGATFIMRSRIALDLPGHLALMPCDSPVFITSPDGRLAKIAAAEVYQATGRQVFALHGGTSAWQASGRSLESGDEPALSPPHDVYRRPYEGLDNPRQKMQAYLDWEYGLVAQLERDGSHGFFVIGRPQA